VLAESVQYRSQGAGSDATVSFDASFSDGIDRQSRLGLQVTVRFDSICEYAPAVPGASYVPGQACVADITLDHYVPGDPNAFDDGDTPDPPEVYDPTRQCELDRNPSFVAARAEAALPLAIRCSR